MKRNIAGQRFGRLVAQRWAGADKSGLTLWQCLCDCGTICVIRLCSLTSGTQSCGCLHREGLVQSNFRHGHAIRGANTAEYRSFVKAKERCTDPKNKNWKDYGGRGIEFRLVSFQEFLQHIGMKPTPKHTLDRINNDGHYEIGNIRWATRREQRLNQRLAA